MLSFALRNVFRHKARTALTLAAIVFGVTGLIVSGGFVRDVLFQLSEATIHSQSGHLQVHRKGFFERGARAPDKYLIDDAVELRQRIASLRGVTDTLARLNFTGLLGNGRTDLPVVGEGVEADRETRLGSYIDITSGRQLTDRDAYGILLGEGIAKALKVGPGDRVALLLNTTQGAINSLDFEVIGVFRTFSKEFDARAVRLPLAAAQELLGTSGVNSLVVSLARTEDTERVALEVSSLLDTERFELKTWRELNEFYQKAVDLYERQFGVLLLIVLVMVLLTVANTVNMTVFERIGEFGTLQAMGNRRSHVFRLIVLEAAMIGLLGAALGAAIGVFAAWAVTTAAIAMPPLPNANVGYTMSIRLTTGAVTAAFAIGLVATLLASFWPAARVSRKSIVESLRQNV